MLTDLRKINEATEAKFDVVTFSGS